MGKLIKSASGKLIISSSGKIVTMGDLPKLSKPTNLSISDTTLTFNCVANATKYKIYANNSLIGTYQYASPHTFTIKKDLTGSGAIEEHNLSFTANGLSNTYTVFNKLATQLYYGTESDTTKTLVAIKSDSWSWAYENANVITFASEPTGDLLEWLTNYAKIYVDLSTLSGWESLESGTYSITVVASADNYEDSDASNGVDVEKAPSGYSVNVSGTFSPKDKNDTSTKTTINGITSISDPFGNTNIPYTYTNVSTFTVTQGDNVGGQGNVKIISGTATINGVEATLNTEYICDPNASQYYPAQLIIVPTSDITIVFGSYYS